MAKKILLVEDEKLIREMYVVPFQNAGYSIDTADDGQQAVDKILQNPTYDLILLDLMMPKLDGISVLKKIKAPDSPAKSIPVFLLTNLGMDQIIKEAMAIGAEKFIVKANFLPDQLETEVSGYFKQKELENLPSPQQSQQDQPNSQNTQ